MTSLRCTFENKVVRSPPLCACVCVCLRRRGSGLCTRVTRYKEDRVWKPVKRGKCTTLRVFISVSLCKAA